MSDQPINAYTLRHLHVCERRIWLDHYGDTRKRDRVVSDRTLIGIEHEHVIGQRMFGPTEAVYAESWDDMVAATLDLMLKGVPGIEGGAFERTARVHGRVFTLRGRIDWMRQVKQPSQLGPWAYEPVEIKHRKELNDVDKLQLDLYIWFLSEAQGVEPEGWFWLGRDDDDAPAHVEAHQYDARRLANALGQVSAILDTAEPAIFLGSHCRLCHWQSACTERAAEQRAFTLLPGLSQITWNEMRRAGLSTYDEVAALTVAELQKFKGVGKARAREMQTSAQAMSSGKPILRSPLPAAVRDAGVMLDLETSINPGDGSGPWCFGWMEPDSRVEIAIVAPHFTGESLHLPDGHTIYIVPDSDSGWRLFAEHVRGRAVYHWGGFEQQVMRGTAPRDVIEALDGTLIDLNRVFKNSFALPLRSTSIKTVAPYFGFAWPEGTNAFSAWHDYNAWLVDGDHRLIARACAYNRADVEAMDIIWRWMVAQSAP